MRALLALLLCATLASAQTFAVKPTKQLSLKRLHFVIDVSGSVSPKLGQVLEAVRLLAAPGSDELEIKVTVFSSVTRSWGRGWVAMPGPEDMAAAQKLIEETVHANTRVLAALTAAMTEETKKPVTVVLVTDGLFVEEPQGLILHAAAKSKHTLLVYGVGHENRQTLTALGSLGGGYLTQVKE